MRNGHTTVLARYPYNRLIFYVRDIMQNITHSTSSQNRRAVINAQKALILGKTEIERLDMIVHESIKAFSITTHLAQNEVVEILGKINVEALNEVQAAVENLKGIEGIDTVRIAVAVEETIRAIAATTGLDTDEISKILTEKSGATVEDMVHRLHEMSRHPITLLML
jgi:restriction endonuclease